MKYKWLNCNKNDKLIVFFNGWGMDEAVVKHLEYDDFDVLMFYDYNLLVTNFDFESIKKYTQKHLIAWSMGVMTASLFDISYNSKTAINGTLKPIDDKFGIPNRIYDLTLKNFSPNGAKKFISNMFYKLDELPQIKREFDNQKSELFALKNYKANSGFKYNKVIISKYDKIIPTKNQILFWNQPANIESGHCPFMNYKKWSDLI